MVEQETKQRRPFHETIVDIIHSATCSDLDCLGALIKMTKIPKGHDEIIAAWNQRRQEMDWGEEDLDVPSDLLEQKQEAEKENEKKELAKKKLARILGKK